MLYTNISFKAIIIVYLLILVLFTLLILSPSQSVIISVMISSILTIFAPNNTFTILFLINISPLTLLIDKAPALFALLLLFFDLSALVSTSVPAYLVYHLLFTINPSTTISNINTWYSKQVLNLVKISTNKVKYSSQNNSFTFKLAN